MIAPPAVLVLSGGISHERDVSLRSGRRVSDALTRFGWHTEQRDPDAELLAHLARRRPDVVWPALHGASGEDGALRSLLELLELPFVGASSAAALLAWNKAAARALIAAAGGAVPAGVVLTSEAFRELGTAAVVGVLRDRAQLPLVVKPVHGGSAQGVTIVRHAEELPGALVHAFSYGDEVIVEDAVVGTEIAVGVIDLGDGPRALPAVEIEPVDGDYGFEARYTAGLTRFYTPARLDGDAAAAAAALAELAHRTLGLRDLSRIDIIVGVDGVPWFLEANVMPGLTETSLLPQALASAGLDLGETYAALARGAMERGAGRRPTGR